MRRRATALLLGAALTTGLAACSDDDEPQRPALQEAEKGAEVDIDEFLGALDDSFADGSTATVAFDIRGRVRLRGTGSVRYDADGMDVDLRLADWQVLGGTVNLRSVDGATYLRAPESRGLWVDVTAEESLLPGQLMAEADPRSQLATLRDEITEVRFSGDDTVAGEPARRYQVVARAAEAGPTTTEYWLDDEGRVVRRLTDLGGAGSAAFTWSAWGDPVAIEAPPADRVVTLQELERLRRQEEGQR